MTIEYERALRQRWAKALAEVQEIAIPAPESIQCAIRSYIEHGYLLDGALIQRWYNHVRPNTGAVNAHQLLQALLACDHSCNESKAVESRRCLVLRKTLELVQQLLTPSSYDKLDDRQILLISEALLRGGATRGMWSTLVGKRMLVESRKRGRVWWLGRGAYALAYSQLRRERSCSDFVVALMERGRCSERFRWRLALSCKRESYYNYDTQS